MIINKAYIKIANKSDRTIIRQILEEILENCEVNWEDNVATLQSVDVEAFQLKLIKAMSIILEDLNDQVEILIVPFLNELFIKYLDKMNNEVCTAFEIFLRNINDEAVLKDSKRIINSIEQVDLDTLKAFIKCNANSTITANELFIHRNTFNYRVNHLSKTTDIDIRDLNSLIFLNLIFNICA